MGSGVRSSTSVGGEKRGPPWASVEAWRTWTMCGSFCVPACIMYQATSRGTSLGEMADIAA